MKYNEAGLSEEWIRLFYEWKTGGEAYPLHWICDGLVRVPLRLIDRAEAGEIQSDADMEQPLLLKFEDGKFVYQGQQSFLQKLRDMRKNSHQAFVFITDKSDYPVYVQQYGKQFHQAKI